jgi:hypothetical protein
MFLVPWYIPILLSGSSFQNISFLKSVWELTESSQDTVVGTIILNLCLCWNKNSRASWHVYIAPQVGWRAYASQPWRAFSRRPIVSELSNITYSFWAITFPQPCVVYHFAASYGDWTAEWGKLLTFNCALRSSVLQSAVFNSSYTLPC